MATKVKVEDLIAELAEPITMDLGLELIDVEFQKEGGNWYLRVFIDKPDGINHEDCQLVSIKLSDKLDEIDPISQSYMLEVSSPGLDRPLKKEEDFKRFISHLIRVATFAPVDGKKHLVGTLVEVNENDLIISINGQDLAVPRDKISKVKLEPEF